VPEPILPHFASRQNRMRDFRFGSKADIEPPSTDVCFTPKADIDQHAGGWCGSDCAYLIST
jgi:hypothetical protein